MGEIKKINWVAGSCISKVNSQPLKRLRRVLNPSQRLRWSPGIFKASSCRRKIIVPSLYNLYNDGTMIFLRLWRFHDFILVLSTMQILKSNEKGVSLETCQFSMIQPLHPWMDPPLRTEMKDANARNIIISDFGQVYPLTDLTSF
jgi:hypothetical protein